MDLNLSRILARSHPHTQQLDPLVSKEQLRL